MAQFSNYYLSFSPRKATQNVLLWPVWVWEILAPTPGQMQLNLFQRSILGLLNAGIDDSQIISKWLGIDRQMVQYIIAAQLQPNGWLDEKFKLTQQGLDLFKKDSDSRSELTSAYVFQDAISGKLWPRVVHQLDSIEPSFINQSGLPEFASARETGSSIKPWSLKAKIQTEPEVTPDELFQAVKQGNNAIYNQQLRQPLDGEHKEFYADEIECIEEQPFKAYVFCELQKHPESVWAITDPLALEKFADYLHSTMFEQVQHDQQLARKFSDFFGEIEENESLDDWNARIYSVAEFTLWANYPNTTRIPNLERYLSAFIRRKEQVIVQAEKGNVWHEDWEELINHCQKLFECCFQWLLREYPLHNPRIIEQAWRYDDLYDALEHIAQPFASTSTLRQLSRQKPQQIYRAATKQDTSLRPLIAANLFAQQGHQLHPLQELANNQLLKLDKIIEIAEARNQVAHAAGNNLTVDNAIDFADFTETWLQNFLTQLTL